MEPLEAVRFGGLWIVALLPRDVSRSQVSQTVLGSQLSTPVWFSFANTVLKEHFGFFNYSTVH